MLDCGLAEEYHKVVIDLVHSETLGKASEMTERMLGGMEEPGDTQVPHWVWMPGAVPPSELQASH